MKQKSFESFESTRFPIPSDLISASEARQLLGVSTVKMAKLLKLGTLPFFPDPLDQRTKLVSRAAALALKPQRTHQSPTQVA